MRYLLLSLLFCGSVFASEIESPSIWIHPDMEKAIAVNEKELYEAKPSPSTTIVDGKKRRTGYKPLSSQYEGAIFRDFPIWKGRQAGVPIPDELDYTLISPPRVVEQQCGDCWAQGAAQANEGVIGWTDKVSRDISRQAIIDCSGYGSCGGGQISVGFFESPKGAVYTKDYPYRGRDQRCNNSMLVFKEQARNTGFIRSAGGGKPSVQDYQRAMMEMGPIEVCGASSALGGADKDGFILKNRSGIVDHCWAAYGWVDGKKHGKPDGIYFVFVNSWGVTWGHNGIVYLRVAQDDTKLDGSAVTEGAFIDYKDPVPPGPVNLEMDGTSSLKITVNPGKLSADKVKAALQKIGYVEIKK